MTLCSFSVPGGPDQHRDPEALDPVLCRKQPRGKFVVYVYGNRERRGGQMPAC